MRFRNAPELVVACLAPLLSSADRAALWQPLQPKQNNITHHSGTTGLYPYVMAHLDLAKKKKIFVAGSGDELDEARRRIATA